MVVSGGLALRLAYRLGLARWGSGAEIDPAGLARHRAAGKTALGAGIAGLVSAAYVLLGMYLR